MLLSDKRNIKIETNRLILRQWKEEDKIPFSELNADKKVMEFFPSILSKQQSDLLLDKCNVFINENGWGLFAVEIKRANEFIGFIGLNIPNFNMHFTPCTEIGWRIHKKYWKQGYATEGAKEVLNFAFSKLNKNEVVSFTSKLNLPSISVMKRIGMEVDLLGEFDHPKIELNDRLCRHVLYRIKKAKWKKLKV